MHTLKVASGILFFVFSIVLFLGTNNMVILLAKLSVNASSELVAGKLKVSLNSIMEEEKSEKNEDTPDGQVLDIICDQITHVSFFNFNKTSEYVASDDLIASIHDIPIFIPPPNF